MTAEPYAGQRPAWRLPVRALGRRSRRAFAGSALLVLLLLLVELARWTLPPPRPDAAEAGLSGALGLPVPR